MPQNVKDIKERINATKKTMQITSAMHMVSASKMRFAEKAIKEYQQYMVKIEEIVSSVLSTNLDLKLAILEEREVKNELVIVINSDRGLAGAYNSSVIKALKEDIEANPNITYHCLQVGNKAVTLSKKLNCQKLEKTFLAKDEIDIINVNDLVIEFVNMYNNMQVDKVSVYFNHYINTLTQVVEKKQILPILKNESAKTNDYEIDQDVEVLVETLLPLYFENIIYGVLLDAKASEHAARRTAMKSATDNAKDVISSLEVIYNRARQAAITTELIDIISGSNAQN